MKHGLVTRRVADSIAEGRRVWVYLNPPGSEREGLVEVVGYSVEIGFWVKIVLADDNLLFNGFMGKESHTFQGWGELPRTGVRT